MLKGGAKTAGCPDDVFLTFESRRHVWTIGNKKIEQAMQVDGSGNFRLIGLKDRIGGCDYADNSAPFGFCASLEGAPIAGISAASGFSFQGYRRGKAGRSGLELSIAFLYRPRKLRVTLVYRCYPGTSVIENYVVLQNAGRDATGCITDFGSGFYALKFSATLNAFWVKGCLGAGYGSAGSFPPDSFVCNKAEVEKYGKTEIYSGEAVSSRENVGWCALEGEKKAGVFLGIEWSGDWRMLIGRNGDSVSTGWALGNFSHRLNPGESIESPKSFLGIFSGGLQGASIQTHEFCREHIFPGRPQDFPWVVYNTWFHYSIELKEDVLKKEADIAKDIGIELFYLDAGWYRRSPAEGGFHIGLGDWHENPKKFPSGLAAFSDYVHRKGMKFGLWVEPERVDPQTVSRSAGDGMWREEWRKTVGGKRADLLCLAHKECRRWVKDWLAQLVSRFKLDWLKWDHNQWANCEDKNHGHQEGDGGYRHVKGLYEIMEYLNRKFPGLIIENCAGGGNRMDFGIMRYCNSFWLSDDTWSAERVRHYVYGAGIPFPPEALGVWVVSGNEEKITQEKVSYLCRSRMPGGLGFCAPLQNMSSGILGKTGKEIELYKRIRPFLKGETYRLFPQSKNLNVWDGFQYRLPDRDESVVLVYRMKGSAETRVNLGGLDPGRGYILSEEDGEGSIVTTGGRLMKEGFICALKKTKSCSVVWVKPVKQKNR